MEAKVEEELEQTITCILDSSSKVEKVWDFCATYKWVQDMVHPWIHLNDESFHT